MNWKVSLDMYLTSPPDDGFDGWAEDLFDCFDDVFYNTNEKWIDEYDGVCNKWLNKLFYDKCVTPKEAAIIIQRAFKIFIKNK